jgi:hypothetical protein
VAEPGRFHRKLERALALLQREAPLHFEAVRARFGGHSAVVHLGEEAPLRVSFVGGPPWVRTDDAADVVIELGLDTLDAVLGGDLGLEQGIEQGRVTAQGELDAVLGCLDAFHAFLHGALRSPSFPGLYQGTFAK